VAARTLTTAAAALRDTARHDAKEEQAPGNAMNVSNFVSELLRAKRSTSLLAAKLASLDVALLRRGCEIHGILVALDLIVGEDERPSKVKAITQERPW